MNNLKQLTVLLVEDEPADAYLVKTAFKKAQVLVDLHHVADGVEAFAFLRREGEYSQTPEVDLILLDLNMPRLDGRQFLQQIKADPSLRRIPVVMLTTSDAEKDMLHCYDQSAAGYMVKPGDIEELMKMMRGIGNYWIKIVRLPEHD